MNCKHRQGYEFNWENMKPCSLCDKENLDRMKADINSPLLSTERREHYRRTILMLTPVKDEGARLYVREN